MDKVGASVGQLLERWRGHWQTVGPGLVDDFQEPALEATPWCASVTNERGELIEHSGAYHQGERRDLLVVILHGLGGHVDRGYCLNAAVAADRQGLSTLRLALRGSDGRGADFHHAGLTSDLARVLQAPPLDAYERIALVGYSLGGHVALSAQSRCIDDRLRATVAICPPLDLSEAQRSIDRRRNWIYREYILRALKEMYARLVSLGCEPTPVDRVLRCRSLREWDALTVVPRFGFGNVDHYYRSQSVGPRLQAIDRPTLIVASPGDPMIPASSLRPHLKEAPDAVTTRWVDGGGHVYFPARADLGLGSGGSVEDQVMAWIDAQIEP